MATATGFERINAALGKYYKSQGDNSFYDDSTPDGKFLFYCEDNGFDVDEIEEELAMDPNECAYCDFDPQFPIDKSAKIASDDEEAKLAYILQVLRECHKKGAPPIYFSTMSLDLKMSKKDLSDTKHQYKEQCPKLFPQAQEDLTQAFAIGLKNDFPFITYLVDAFQRDKMLHAHQQPAPHNMLNVNTWSSESPYFKQLNSRTNQRQIQVMKQAMVSYNKRLAPPFPWKAVNKIQDDISPIMEYFVAGGQFVQSLLAQKKVPPFCYELLILVQKTSSTHKMTVPELGDDSEDDEEDDSDDDGKSEEEDENKYFDDIEGRLKAHNCQMATVQIKDDKTRSFVGAFNEMAKKIKDQHGGDKALNEYPRKKRFCSIIDRRGGDNQKNDHLLMFEPPDANSMPDNMVPDWYFNAAKTCAVPSKEYKPKGIEKDPKSTIRVDNAYKGQLITLSFQVDSAMSVRCYLFWNGCYIRIVTPSDLRTILAAMFDAKHGRNEEYLKGKVFAQTVDKFHVVDDTFAAFYKEVKTPHGTDL